MAFGNFLKAALPIAAGIFGSPALGAAVGAGLSYWDSRKRAGAAEQAGAQAGQTAQQGFNYLSGSPIATSYLPAGAAATEQQSALLGLGGDPAAADAAYQQYLQSTGYQGELESGMNAIDSNAAASGARGSGATLKALQRYGTQLGRQGFNNYLGQLRGLSQQGLQAGGMIGNAAQAGGMAQAGYQYGAAGAATDARSQGFNALAGGLGGIFEAIQAGRGKPSPVPGAVKTDMMSNRMKGYA